jgi:hypothetical protein
MSFLNDMFGTKVSAPQVQAPQINFTPAGFSGGGLSGGFANNTYSVGASAGRNAAVGGVANTFGQQAQDIAGVRQQWAPGMSNLRSSLMTALQNNRTQGLGNLRDNLAQRRVLGSSFAQNSLANADQQYQQQIEQVQAQTFLTELSAQQQLIQQQYTAARGQFQTSLDEMNLEAGITTQLTSQATSALSSAANTQAQLDLQAQTTNAKNSLDAQKINSDNTMKTLGGIGSLVGLGLSGGFGGFGSFLGGLLPTGSAAFGGGSLWSGDAFGGSSSSPLPGLSASDYGAGF